MEYSKEFSFLSKANIDFIDIPDGTVVYSSSFYSEEPNRRIFRNNMRNVTFILCNLDNLHIPPGNTLIDCKNRRFKAQNDGHDWEVDKNNKPIKLLMGDKIFQRRGKPIPTPDKIPATKRETPANYLGAE